MPTRRHIALLLAALTTGCAGLPGARVTTIGGQTTEHVMRPGPGPTVVFENGLGGHMAWWQKVLPGLDADSAYFAYNRPGQGQSAAATTPRDGAHIVAELRALLAGLGQRPPYVLVGHSLGGLYMQLFARQHPDEVAALVLVDSTHPRQMEGAGAMEQQSLWVRGLMGALLNEAAKAELAQVARTGSQVLALPPPRNLPVQVLSAAQPLADTSPLGQFTNEKRRDIARLYPGSTQVWVDSGHAIPLEKPEAVVRAVREALDAARQADPRQLAP